MPRKNTTATAQKTPQKSLTKRQQARIKKHLSETEKRIDATMKEAFLGVRSERKRPLSVTSKPTVARAILELLTNEATPADLHDRLEEWLCEAQGGSISTRWNLPGGLIALENLITFAEWKEANND